MIVNTAYIYMGSGGGGGGTPANPNLWQDGVANYPVEFTKNSSIKPKYLSLISGGSATFSELLLTGFNSLTISKYGDGFIPNIPIKIEFFNSSGQLLGTETVTFAYSTTTQSVNIPSAAKIQNAKIRMTNENSSKNINLSSAVLS